MTTQAKILKTKSERLSWESISNQEVIELKAIIGKGKRSTKTSYPKLQKAYNLLVL